MNIILGLCLLAFSVHEVASLKCYECFTGCDDPFNEKDAKEKDCSGSCAKREAAGHVVRSCLSVVKKNYCEEVSGVKVCFCTEDLCNGAPKKSLKCYECLTGCDDPFNEKDATKTYCSGSCSKGEAAGHVVRNCLPGVKKNYCEEFHDAKVCYCTEDLCNGAPKKPGGSGGNMSGSSFLVTMACICLSVLKFNL